MSRDDSPPTSDDEDEDTKPLKSVSIHKISALDHNSDSTDSQSSGTESPTYTAKTSSTAHVRSCARFPLLTQAIKQMSTQTNTFTNILPKNSSANASAKKEEKKEVKGLAALVIHKKKNVSARDRLFKSLKGLKKSSKSSVVSTGSTMSSSTVKKISKSSISSTISTSTSISTSTTTSSSMAHNHSSNSSTSSSTSHSHQSNASIKTEPNGHDFNDESTDDEIEDVSHLATVDDNSCDMKDIKRMNESNNELMPNMELIRPKYVVRPAPLECDISSDDETEEDSNEDTDEDSNDANNNRVKRQRMKSIQKYFRKLKSRKNELSQMRDVMVPVMRYLSHKDLMSCMSVCKEWYGFALEPKFWKHLDLSHKKVTGSLLKAVVMRQPRHLNLSWTGISRKQLFWLICRLPQLESLSLVGCSSAAVSSLATCNCPLLAYLDISWTTSLDDDLMQDLLSAPNDSRPGLMETKTRLRFLSEIRVCGEFALNYRDRNWNRNRNSGNLEG